MANKKNFDVYVGSEIGLLKGVRLEENIWENINSVSESSKENEITCLCLYDEENKVCVGTRSRKVLALDTVSLQATEVTLQGNTGSGAFCGIATYNGSLVTCTEDGALKVWQDEKNMLSTEIGKGVCCMHQNKSQRHLVATGGRENELKLWNLQQPAAPIFQAKNISNDFLNLRVPVWVSDIDFLPGSQTIVTCTRHHQVRVYDPLCGQRRPVLEVNVGDHPLTCLSVRPDHQQVLVGSSHGRLTLVDLRSKGHAVQCYKGFSGAIKDVQCVGSGVVSCGLDRFLRVHDIESKRLLHKVYLKSRLNCLLCPCDSTMRQQGDMQQTEVCSMTKATKDNSECDTAGVRDTDELWEQMETVVSSTKIRKLKRHREHSESLVEQRKKQKTVLGRSQRN